MPSDISGIRHLTSGIYINDYYVYDITTAAELVKTLLTRFGFDLFRILFDKFLTDGNITMVYQRQVFHNSSFCYIRGSQTYAKKEWE